MLRKIFLMYLCIVLLGCQGEKCEKVQLGDESYLFERLGEIILKDNTFSEYLDKSSPLTNEGKYYRGFSMYLLNSSNLNYQDSIQLNSIIDSLKSKNLIVNEMTIGRQKELLFTVNECFKDIDGQLYSFSSTVVYNYKNRDLFKSNSTSYKIYSDSIVSDRIRLLYLSMPTGH